MGKAIRADILTVYESKAGQRQDGHPGKTEERQPAQPANETLGSHRANLTTPSRPLAIDDEAESFSGTPPRAEARFAGDQRVAQNTATPVLSFPSQAYGVAPLPRAPPLPEARPLNYQSPEPMKTSSSANLQTKAILFLDTVGSSKTAEINQAAQTTEYWQHSYELLRPYSERKGLAACNTWGDGLVAVFHEASQALQFAEDFLDRFQQPGVGGLRFRIVLHYGLVAFVENPVRGLIDEPEEKSETKTPCPKDPMDVVGPGVITAARLEPSILPGSLAVTDDFYRELLSKCTSPEHRSNLCDCFTVPTEVARAKESDADGKPRTEFVRYYEESLSSSQKDQLEKEIAEAQSMSSVSWALFTRRTTVLGTAHDRAIASSDFLALYLINGGYSARLLAKKIKRAIRQQLGANDPLRGKKDLILYTMQEDANDPAAQKKALVDSGLLIHSGPSHLECLKETHNRFYEVAEHFGWSFRHYQAPARWAPLGAVLLTERAVFFRPIVFSGERDKLQVVQAGAGTLYYQQLASSLEKIQDHCLLFSSRMFFAHELEGAQGFVAKILKGEDKVSAFLHERIPPSLLERLSSRPSGEQPGRSLWYELAAALNKILWDSSIGEDSRFKSVDPRDDTEKALKLDKKGEALLRANRSLLEDAYPDLLPRLTARC